MAINTGVSLKYETDFGECVSQISGVDLCKQQDLFLGLTYSCGVIFLILIGILIYRTVKWKHKRILYGKDYSENPRTQTNKQIPYT